MVFDQFFLYYSSIAGVPADHLRVLVTLLSAYPLALVFRLLPQRNPNLKHLFSFTFAVFVFFGVFELARGFYTLMFSALTCYAITASVKGKWMPRLVFLIALGHLSVSHIYRQRHRVSLEKFEMTGPQMVLVIKLTSFAFSVYDGQKPIQELTPYQKKKRIVQIPSLLEFLGYTFFFGGFLVGPAFEFMDYRKFTTMEAFCVDDLKEAGTINDGDDEHRDGDTAKSETYIVPNGAMPAIKRLSLGVLFIVCTLLFARDYPMEWVLSEEYKNSSFYNRFCYVQIAAFCARFKFYIVWSFAEGACILSGLGFNGYDEKGKAKWDRVTNIDVIAYETADNIKALLEAWNKNTNKWLKNYVYLRVTPPGKKPTFLSTFATFGTSAVWHGFYPGYYLTFVTGAFVQRAHQVLRRNIRPVFLTPEFVSFKPVYDFLGWFITQSTVNYLVMPFLVLSLRSSLYAWKLNYFYVHIGIVIINLISAFLSTSKMLKSGLKVM